MLDRLSPPPPVAVDFVERLRQLSADWPDRVAYTYLVDGEDQELIYTYRELDNRARAIGQRLIEMGMTGERALLLFPPGLDFVSTIFGCFYAGVVAVPAFPPRRNRNMARIEAISRDAQAKVAITIDDHIQRVAKFSDDAPELKTLEWIAADKIEIERAKEWKRPDFQSESLAVLQYTSGSTGKPKGVMLTHGNLIRNCQYITHAFGAQPHDVGMSWLPAYHDMGLIGGILNPIYISCTNVLMSPVAFLQKPLRWMKAVTKYKVSISGGPNFAYDYCTKKVAEEELSGLNLESWGVAYNGAEPVRYSTIEEFVRKFGPCGFRTEAFYPCYGMAESTLMITGGLREQAPVSLAFDAASLDVQKVKPAAKLDAASRQLVACGSQPPNGTVLVVDPEKMQRCKPDEIGEIWVSSPSVGVGYFNKDVETQETFRAQLIDGSRETFLRTGDLGFWRDGQLYVTGRIKDLITIRGVNRYPQDIEMTVEQSDKRLRTGASAAFAVDADGREQLIIVSEAERVKENNWDEVISAIRRDVTKVHELAPDGVILVRTGSIPKTSSGKIQRHACRSGFQDDSLLIIAKWFRPEDEQTISLGTNGHHATAGKNGHADSSVTGLASLSNGNGHSGNGNGSPNGSMNSQNGQYSRLQTVFAMVRNIAQDRAGDLSAETNILDLGLDSLERLEIVSRLEDHYGGSFPEYVLQEMETCQQVAAAIETHLIPFAGDRNDAIDSSTYRFEEFDEFKRLEQSKAALSSTGLDNPYFPVHSGTARDTTTIDGRSYINFASYNYVGLSGEQAVNESTALAVEQYGTSCSASRLVSGEKEIHRELESEIADFLGVPDAITFVGGHATNQTTIGHLVGAGDLIIHDSLAHNSIVQGAILSGARRRQFPHNDWNSLDQILTTQRSKFRRVLIAIEGAYSMDGDYPDLAKFVEIKERHKALLMVDEAHSLGTMGATGRGISEHANIDTSRVDIWMGTLSKSLGSCGGYIAGSRPLVELLRYTAPGFVYSVGLSPPDTAAALASLRYLRKHPERVAKCQKNAALFLRLAHQANLNTGASGDTPIVPVILGNSVKCLWLSQQLFERGINVQPIMYPAVAEAESRLRFFITSQHSVEQIRKTVDAMNELLPMFSDFIAGNELRMDQAATTLKNRVNGFGNSVKTSQHQTGNCETEA